MADHGSDALTDMTSGKTSTLSNIHVPPGQTLKHRADEFLEQLDDELGTKGLRGVAKGQLSTRATTLIDFPMNQLPALPDVADAYYHRQLTFRLECARRNAAVQGLPGLRARFYAL